MRSGRLLRAWLPVLVWLGIIAIESTEAMGSSHTEAMLARVLAALHAHISPQLMEAVNHILRKSGHFLGYGMLCLLFARAWLLTLAPSFNGRPALARAVMIALLCTLCVASTDELHQRYLQGRTGTPVDVAVDMTGAAFLSIAASGRLRRVRH